MWRSLCRAGHTPERRPPWQAHSYHSAPVWLWWISAWGKWFSKAVDTGDNSEVLKSRYIAIIGHKIRPDTSVRDHEPHRADINGVPSVLDRNGPTPPQPRAPLHPCQQGEMPQGERSPLPDTHLHSLLPRAGTRLVSWMRRCWKISDTCLTGRWRHLGRWGSHNGP